MPDPPLTPPPGVTLKVTLNWVGDDGQITATDDITSRVVRDVAALIPRADAKGGFETRAAETAATGLAIRDVPPGATYYLDLPSLAGRLLYVTDERDVDLKFYELGRKNPVQPTKATPLTVDVTGMSAWQDGDTLALYCAHVDAFGALGPALPGLSGWPMPGDTHLELTVDWGQVDHGFFQDRMTPLIDGNQGDRLIVSHGRRQGSSNGYPYDAALETSTFSSFTQTDGQSRIVDGAFATTPQDAVHVNLKRPEFVRYAHDIHPDAMINPGFLGGGGLAIRAQPADPQHQRVFTALLPSMAFTLFNADTTTDVDMGQMVYPRPPSTWSQWLNVTHGFAVTRDTPFGLPHTAAAAISVTIPITPGAPTSDVVSAVAPRISPPSRAMIDGVAFAAPHLGLYQPSATPMTVTWEEPTLIDAAPTSYALAILQLDRAGDTLTAVSLATIGVPAKPRSVSIPWQLFPGPGAYYFVLTAIAAAGEHDPKIGGTSGADSTADAVSGILTLR